MIEKKHRELLQLIWRRGPLSRSQLHELTEIRLNTIGLTTSELLEAGILRERGEEGGEASGGRGRGRPPVPLEIDSAARHVLGVAMLRRQVRVGRLNLIGELIESPVVCDVDEQDSLIVTAANLLADNLNERTLAIGLTTPGLIDPEHRQVLLSAAIHAQDGGSLEPIFNTAGNTPLALDNDAHGLAAHWVLLHPQLPGALDTLLVLLGDGQLGSSLLIDGKPNTGSITGANELGHTRLPIDTPQCFCGHTGCLERIASSEFLGRPIDDAVANYHNDDEAMNRLIDYLAMGLANAVNFTRISRLVLASAWMKHDLFAEALEKRISHYVLGQLNDRLTIQSWDRPASEPATTAGCLALADLFCPRWESFSSLPQLAEV